MKYCFLDLETTGFSPEKDSIIEISFVMVEDGKKISEYDQVIQPDKSEISDFVAQLTGITTEETQEKGIPFNTINDIVRTKIGDAIIVGHNIDFDINFLIANGVDLKNNERIDTHELARILLPKEDSFALEVLTQKYGFSHENAHRAMSDVLASWDLYKLLIERIEALPKAFLDKIRPFLQTKTDWYAKNLFLDKNGQEDSSFVKPETKKEILHMKISDEFQQKFEDNETLFLKIGNHVDSANFYKNIAQQNFEKTGQKFCIISPKLKFFSEVSHFPTPSVILDPKRLDEFSAARKSLDNAETTFYLKCQYRSFLGFRGLDGFDLFFKERDTWGEVNIQDISHPIFQEILKEREKESTIVLTPQAFFQFHDLPLFKDRVLLIDEAEEFAETLLHTPTKNYSLQPFLENPNEEISSKAQFFVTRFCKDVLEPRLEHKMNQFPQRILLGERETLPEIAAEIEEFEDSEINKFTAENLRNPEERMVRFFNYFPERGALSFHFWRPDDWRQTKEILSKFKKVIGHRTNIVGDSIPFFRIFLGISEGAEHTEYECFTQKKLVIPPNIISQNSPDYNAFCVDKVITMFNESDENIAFNFSSLETLRKAYDQITAEVKGNNVFVAGEKVMGGNGKLLQLFKKNKDKKILFCVKKFLTPEIENYQFKNLVIQKLPFNAPHPLVEKIEKVISQSGQNFFDIWVMTQVANNLSQTAGNYPEAKKIILLDPRENTKWGKKIIDRGLSSFLQ